MRRERCVRSRRCQQACGAGVQNRQLRTAGVLGYPGGTVRCGPGVLRIPALPRGVCPAGLFRQRRSRPRTPLQTPMRYVPTPEPPSLLHPVPPMPPHLGSVCVFQHPGPLAFCVLYLPFCVLYLACRLSLSRSVCDSVLCWRLWLCEE